MGAFNSRQYEWNDISIVMLGRVVGGARGIKYKVKKEKEVLYAQGNTPYAIQHGNKSYEGSITLLQSEVEALELAAKSLHPSYDLTDIQLDVVVQYAVNDLIKTDTLKGVSFEGYEKGMKQGDKYMEIDLDFKALAIVNS